MTDGSAMCRSGSVAMAAGGNRIACLTGSWRGVLL